MRKILLEETLKKVARSFYLTLRVVPPRIRDPMGLAYLFCRAADTIADTDLIPEGKRLKCLELFRRQFHPDTFSWEIIAEIRRHLIRGPEYPEDSPERFLLQHLEDCFQCLSSFPPEDQDRIRQLVPTLTRGMEMDLACFSPQIPGAPKSLPTKKDLDQYCYFVAGVVGEFWTRMLTGHFRSLREWDEERMCALGMRFGKGLQMTNILKDLAVDLRRGRCYLPQNLLKDCELGPQDLQEVTAMARLRPLLLSQIRMTLSHLEVGWQYILAIPRHEVRLRLACLWPLLFAIQTLEQIHQSHELLNHRVRIKITRSQVYTTLILTVFLVFSNRLLTRYYHRLRDRLMIGLDGN